VLRICELTLAGFGVYEEPTRFLLPNDGSAIFWGSNETGKSTFLWGVAAVWFGLPKNSDPSKIGTERFHSFGHPAEFWGEIIWEHEGRRFTLHREFELQRVILSEETPEGERILFDGDHNPQGRTSTGSAFAQHLRERLGMTQLELYLETFCISQPMSGDDTIGQELQHLISGSRATKIDDVLTTVWNQVKELTRATGDLGVARPGTNRPTNQREPGRIERLETAMAQARLDETLARTQLEKLNDGNQALESAQKEVDLIRRRQEDRKGRLEALGQWTKENKERVRRTERLQQLDLTIEEYDRLCAQQKAVEEQLANEFASFSEAPGNLTQLLERVEDAAEARDRLAAQGEEWNNKKDQRKADIAELESELETTFAEVRGRSDWVETRRKLLEATARCESKKNELLELEKNIARRERDLEATETLDSFAVEACQAHAGILTESFRRIERIEEKLVSLEEQIEEREFLGTENRLAKLHEKIALEHELRECSISIREKRAAALEARIEETEAAARQARGDAEHDPGTSNQEMDENSISSRPGRTTWPFGLIAAAAISAAIHFGLSWSWILAGAVGVALFVTWFVLDRLRGSRPKSTGSEGISPGQRLRRRLQETQPEIKAELTTPEPRSSATEAADELDLLQSRQAEIEELLEGLRAVLGEYAKTNHSELAAMEERWRMVDEQVEGLRAERAELLESRFGASDDESWRGLPVTESDEYVERLLSLPGAPTAEESPSVSDLLAWLQKLTEEDWSIFKEAEAARGQAIAELESLRQRNSQLEVEAADKTEILLLEKELAPFTLETEPKELLRLSEDCQDAERKLQSLKDRSAEYSEKTFQERIKESEEAIDEVWEGLSAAWDCERPTEEPLADWANRMRNEAGPARDAQKRLAQLEDSAETILRSSLFKTRDELIEHRTSEDAALGQTVRELTRLEETELALATEEKDPSADRASRLGKLREAEERAALADQQSAETAEEEVRRLLRGMASLEGREIPNLASLELRFRRQEEELKEATRERDAFVEAFRWMEEAAETFQGTYRETLEHRITKHFQGLTDGLRRVDVTEKFEILVRDAAGRELCIDQLSQGARDQLLLSIRLGVSDLLSGSVPLPFFFDDAFVHFDESRLALAKKTLDGLGRQWILLSHRKDLSNWADPIFTNELSESGESTPTGTMTEESESMVGTGEPAMAVLTSPTTEPTPRRRSSDADRRKPRKKLKGRAKARATKARAKAKLEGPEQNTEQEQGTLDLTGPTEGDSMGDADELSDDRRSGTSDR